MRKFRPRLGPTIASLVMIPLLISLGFWQLDRADEKRQAARTFLLGQQRPPETINQRLLSTSEDFFWQRVSGTGNYLATTILLDNRIRDGRAGYDVLSPLTSTDGTTVLVDRGWVPANADRSKPPILTQLQLPTSYQGNLGPPPATGIAINEHGAAIETLAEGVLRVQQIDINLLARELSLTLINGVLYLGNESPNGFRRDWPTPGFNPEKHEAYATQWFVMAVIVAGLFVVLNLEKIQSNDIEPGPVTTKEKPKP